MTTTAYSEDGLTTTVTTPAGATSITTRNTDGSTASIGGTAQRALVYVYDINGNSERHTTKLANGTTIAQSITNGFGQTTVQAQASTSGFINTRSELVAATVNGTNYEYAYDNIGNRTSATEGDEVTGYASNELNQYTMIRRSAEDFFVPEFDADGNQYHIQTETGDWTLNYNAANRPTDFSCMDEEGNFLTVK